MTAPLTAQQLDVLVTRLTYRPTLQGPESNPWLTLHNTVDGQERERFVAAAFTDVPVLLAEVARLRAELEQADRDLGHELANVERLHEVADKLAYAIAPVEVIGEHSDHNDPWDNAYEELFSQRKELADTAMMRDFNQRSAEHIAGKRDLAEVAIASWDRGEISGDAAVLTIRRALAAAPACSCAAETVHQAGCDAGTEVDQ